MKKVLFSIAFLGLMQSAIARTKDCKHHANHKYTATKRASKADPNVGLAQECGTMANFGMSANGWYGNNTVNAYTGYRADYTPPAVYDPIIILNYYRDNLTPRDNMNDPNMIAPQTPNADHCNGIAPQSPNSDACGK